MKNLKVLFIAPLLAVLAVPAMAGHGYDGNRVEKRLDRQESRIAQGVRSGELTRKEERRLRKKHRKVEDKYVRYTRDDRLSRKERSILHERLDENSQWIKRLKHNDRQREVHVKRFERSRHHDRDRHVWRDYERSPFEHGLWSFVLDERYRW